MIELKVLSGPERWRERDSTWCHAEWHNAHLKSPKPFVQWYTVYGIIQIYIENEKRPLELQNQIGIRKNFNLGRKFPFLAHMTALQLISIFGLP